MNHNHVHDESCGRSTVLDKRIREFRKLLIVPMRAGKEPPDVWGVVEKDGVLVLKGEPPPGMDDVLGAINLLFKAYNAYADDLKSEIGGASAFALSGIALGMTLPEEMPCGCLEQSDPDGKLVTYCFGHMINAGLGGMIRE